MDLRYFIDFILFYNVIVISVENKLVCLYIKCCLFWFILDNKIKFLLVIIWFIIY